MQVQCLVVTCNILFIRHCFNTNL